MRVNSKVSALLAFLLFSLSAGSSVSHRQFTIHLHQLLGAEYACSFYRTAIQFISEDELLLTAGPSEDCYRSVNQNELVVLSLQSRIIARKSWPSTYPVLVFANNRIAVFANDQVQIFDDHFALLQSLPLPEGRGPPLLSVYSPGTLEIRRDGTALYRGDPLERVKGAVPSPPEEVHPIFHLDDGTLLGKKGSSLIEIAPDAVPRTIADLSWAIPPCVKYEYCQAYDAGTTYQTVVTQESRLLVCSNGSRFPVTDAAGLFPYFRVTVFDLKSGREVYREQDTTKTSHRGAAISPKGDLLVTYDGSTAIVHKLDDMKH